MISPIALLDGLIRAVVAGGFLLFALRIGFPDTGWNWAAWMGVVPALAMPMLQSDRRVPLSGRRK